MRELTRAEILRSRLKKGEFLTGGHVFFVDSAISEAMALCGYDFIWIDGEHSPFDKNTLLAHIMAVNCGNAAAIVRVTENNPAVIKPILEMGADGIIIPNVMTGEEAQKAVQACMYPPKGIRGFGPRRAVKYGIVSTADYLQYADESILKIVQIEHHIAVKNIDEILEVPYLDAIVIGPNDLSGSLGLLGQPRHEKVLEQAQKVIFAAKRNKIPVGVSIGPDRNSIDIWKNLAVDFISCGDDISFITDGAQKTLDYIRHK